MSNYTIRYEPEGVDVLFEFTPERGTKGALAATAGETTFLLTVDINTKKGRSDFITEAYELYPDAFTLDQVTFRRALVDFAVEIDDEYKARAAKAEEEDSDLAEKTIVDPPAEGSVEYDAAMEILTSDDVLLKAAKAMRRLGHVGEWKNKRLAFICAISARAQLPVQPSTHAQSSAGKNYLWDRVLKLVPPELVFRRTGFSAKALFRTKMSLKDSVLYIQELKGSEGAEFAIRTLQSDNVLKWEATEKQPDGNLANVEYEVEGPTVVVQTTTQNHLHPENETRVVPLYLDESARQTKWVTEDELARAAGERSLSKAEEDEIKATWHDAVRLLAPAEVVIPYAKRIQVPTQPLRVRRDVPRLVKTIKLVAWLHQHSRGRDEAGRILATEDDFKKAVWIVGDSFARAWKSLTPTEEKVYEIITEHVPERLRRQGFKRKNVEDALEAAKVTVPISSLKDALKGLIGGGFLESDNRRGPAGATYTVAKSTNVAGVIKLSPTPSVHSAIKDEIAQDGVDKPDSPEIMDETQSGHSQPLVNSDEQWLKDDKGRNGSRPLDNEELGVGMPNSPPKHTNGRKDEGGTENKKEVDVDFDYS